MTVDAAKLPTIFSPSEVSPHLPNPDDADARIGYAVVGLGRFALEQVLPAMAKSKYCKVTALVSGDRVKAEQVARQYGVSVDAIYDYDNYDRLADNEAVQIVYIVLPNSMHCEFTIRGAQAGKHVLCEKPMATTVDECEQMIAACKAADRRLMIAYRSQYESHDRLLADMIQGQRFGALREIVAVNSQNQGDPQHWRMKRALAGGGPLPDIGIYCINAARFLSGEEPCEVIGHVVNNPDDPRFAEIEESVQFIMRFPSGLVATASSSYNAHKSQYMRLLGTTGWAELNPAFAYTGITLITSQKVDEREVKSTYQVPGDQFAAEIDHMAHCVRNHVQPHTPGEEGLQDMRIVEAIYQSAREGRPVALTQPGSTRGPRPQI